MHSDTLTPLLQFVEFLGLDAWKVAGIDRSGAAASANALNVGRVNTKGDDCFCMFQHPYVSGSHWSRDELIEALQNAEDFFVSEASLYPVPYQISEEGHNNDSIRGYLPSSKVGNKSVVPFYPCGEIRYGNHDIVSLGVYELNRTNPVNNLILDSFSLTFEIDTDVSLDDIRLYFTENDFSGREDIISYNCHIAEIRPFSKITKNPHPTDDTLIIVTIIAPAFLFKKPSLDEIEECLRHELDTYVEEVEVFYERFMPCEYGNAFCSNIPCQNDCEKQSYPICIKEKIVYKKLYAEIIFVDCSVDEDGIVSRNNYCIDCVPNEVCINYITGKSLDNCRRIDRQIKETIGKLALALHDCDKKDFCQCDVCTNSRLKYYRSVPIVKTEDAELNSSNGDEWQVLVSKLSFAYLDGLHPTHGMIQAMREILKWHSCKKVDGTYK